MKLSEEALLEGPLPPPAPRDPYERSVLNTAEHGEDFAREEYVHGLMAATPRPLTHAEKVAAEHDHARAARVYAPASARVAKEPIPADAAIIEEGRHHLVTGEGVAHPGDRSDPSELR